MDFARKNNKEDVLAFLSSISNNVQQPAASISTNVLAASPFSNTPPLVFGNIITPSSSSSLAHEYALNGNVKGVYDEIERNPNVVNEKDQVIVSSSSSSSSLYFVIVF